MNLYQILINPKHSSADIIWMIQKAAAMDNWWLAASSRQYTCSCITTRAEFFLVKHQITQVSTSLQPRFGALWLLAFPETKITFEREEISDHQWDSRKYDRAGDGYWEKLVRSHGAYFEGDWGVTVLCTMFLVYWFFFNKCPCFSCYMAGCLWTDLVYFLLVYLNIFYSLFPTT